MIGQTTVGALVANHPSRSKVFERFGIDYCCGGNDSLDEACRKSGTSLDALLRALEDQPQEPHDRDWTLARAEDVIPHILKHHHDWLKENLPRIDALCEKVARVHGDSSTSPRETLRVFRLLREDMEAHLQKEEVILFPSALHLERTGRLELACHGPVPSLEGPVSAMEHEHLEVAGFLEEIKELTDSFTPPGRACNTWKAAWEALKELDSNTRAHVHLENQVLHPLIRRLEREATAK